MATRLHQVVTFAGVAAGATVALPHLINVSGTAKIPDIVFRDNGSFSIVAVTDALVTVRNDGLAVATLNAWLFRLHSTEREFGAVATTFLTPNPYIPAAGTGGAGGLTNVQAFTYVATGAEGSDFNVPLPAARLNDNYIVVWGLGGVTSVFAADAPDTVGADRTALQFRFVTTAAVAAADRIQFIVADPT